ncbi:hypothetical protein [Mycobacteroides abscessus]|uniref:hypothetical protein n=1 Tax=Mycobacteroides abscessus TaxID=36809 RepID=UPI000928D39F|nr:hypothetical protein [Mycobacteroides abscessus]SHQ46571.1 Uncharacterised protein [Mycobacteroides abscessus subsp. abscessus]SKQ86781.1 Uncharacterised protein [Mycobacteroides abscessus subsp. massiliense]SLC47895.1 Uncharacterised protein [Mycobacteroides abscessus subsp. massiliense]
MTSTQAARALPTIEHLIDRYDEWKAILERDTDDFNTIAQLVNLYRFAIANYSNPLAELLLEAIAAMEQDAY